MYRVGADSYESSDKLLAIYTVQSVVLALHWLVVQFFFN